MYLFLSVDICTAEYWCGDLQGYEAGPDELFLVDLPVLLHYLEHLLALAEAV